MTINEQPFTAEDFNDVEQFSAAGLKLLDLTGTDAEPMAIATAIGRHVDAERSRVLQLSEEEYASFVLQMGYLWGQQVCQAYDWQWAWVGEADQLGQGIVSPDRAFLVYPLNFVKEFVDDVARPTTIILLFNMLAPQFLATQLPQVRPGNYMILG